MRVDLSYIYYTVDITYGILMSSQIGLGLIGNFIYFWCLSKNQKISNPDSSIPTRNNSKFIESNKSINIIENRILPSRQTNPSGSSLLKKRNIYLYIKTLAISDFLFCINSIILPVIYLACYDTCRRSYFFTSFSLKIGFPLMDALTNFSYILKVFISLDRLWALEFPFSYRTKMSNSFIRYLIIVGFIISFSAAIPYGWGYIVVKIDEINTPPILLYNKFSTESILSESIDFNSTYVKFMSVKNNSILGFNKKITIIRYTHFLNPKTPWFQTYRKWITFIISFIPFTISLIANFFIIKKCYKISKNRRELRRGNRVVVNKEVGLLFKLYNKIVGNHNRIRSAENRANLPNENTLPAMQKREFQITILMLALNIHYVLSTIPMTIYMFIYQPWTDTFSTKSALWFQNIAYLTKYGNNALSIYITLFFDPTIKTIFYDTLKTHCCFRHN
ncbi:unnamed protein product [Gordionus sp. m RMFG-2023]